MRLFFKKRVSNFQEEPKLEELHKAEPKLLPAAVFEGAVVFNLPIREPGCHQRVDDKGNYSSQNILLKSPH